MKSRPKFLTRRAGIMGPVTRGDIYDGDSLTERKMPPKFTEWDIGVKEPLTREEVYADDLLPHETPPTETQENPPSKR